MFVTLFNIFLFSQEVHGELIDVDDQMLKVLDELEEHPKIYRRTPVHCIITDEGLSTVSSKADTKESIACETYLLYDFHPELLALPHLNTYSENSEQPYIVEEEDPNCIWWQGLKADQAS